MSTRRVKQRFFDGMVPRWMRDIEKRSARLSNLFSTYALPCAEPILDVGSGTGILLRHLQQDIPPCVVECEISEEMLRAARTSHSEFPRVHYVQSDAQRLPFGASAFRTIYCFSVFPHFDYPHRVIDQFRRCLFPGGTLCILHLMGHAQLNAVHRNAGRAVARDVLPPVDVLADTLTAHGFVITHAEEREDLYLLLAKLPP